MARDWRSLSIVEIIFQKYYFVYVLRTKNGGEFESDVKDLKNKYFCSVEGQNQKTNSKFSVFLGSCAVKIETRRENFRDRCKLIEWESLRVRTSCVAMRARKKQKSFSVFSTGKLLLQLTCTVHVAPGFESRPAPLFFAFVFRFSSFFHCVGAFLGFFFTYTE